VQRSFYHHRNDGASMRRTDFMIAVFAALVVPSCASSPIMAAGMACDRLGNGSAAAASREYRQHRATARFEIRSHRA
jgi:hypothetical protein